MNSDNLPGIVTDMTIGGIGTDKHCNLCEGDNELMDRTDIANPVCGCAEGFTRNEGAGTCEASAPENRCDPNGVGNGKVPNADDPEGPCVCPDGQFLNATEDKC